MTVVDLVAAVLLVAGSALMALGALGLVRFPDVLTRLHASAKAATVGVIATTAAAAGEAGDAAGVFVLLLVAALLFLTGPLGISLLARAAYHDPETRLAPATREMDAGAPYTEAAGASASTHGRRVSPMLAIWLFLVWLALFGSVAPNVLAGGILVAGLVALGFRRLTPRWPRALAHPVHAIRFAVFFFGQLVIATWQVVVALFRTRQPLRPAVVSVPLALRNRTAKALLMNSISFTPGTVALELREAELFIHALDTEDPDDVAREVRALEARIQDIFGDGAPLHSSSFDTRN